MQIKFAKQYRKLSLLIMLIFFVFPGLMEYICGLAPAAGRSGQFRTHTPHHQIITDLTTGYVSAGNTENKPEDPCKRWYWLSGSSLITVPDLPGNKVWQCIGALPIFIV